jgi:RNA polymerase sigma factor (sigma-70 family)
VNVASAWRLPKMTVLSQEEQLELCVKAKAGHQPSTDRLVSHNMGFVFSLARRYSGRSNVVGFDDLIGEGVFGLLDAIQKFEPSQGNAFITYASWWVRHHMIRAIQDRGRTVRTPCHMQDATAKIGKAKRKFATRGVLTPSNAQLAEATGLVLKRVEWAQAIIHEPTSLDVPATEDGADLHEIIPTDELWSDDRLAKAELRSRVRAKCDHVAPRFDDRQRAILFDRLLTEQDEEATLLEIGNKFSLTREAIRLIELEVVQYLRGLLRDEWLEYQGLMQRGPTRAPSVLKATLHEIAEAAASPASRGPQRGPQRGQGATQQGHQAPRSARAEYIKTVGHHLSTFGWPKATMSRHAQFILQAFEWEMEPVQCALNINRRESEARPKRKAQ